MLYNYIYYRVYEFTSKLMDPFAPQFTATLILSAFPLSILYVILRVLSLFGDYNFKMNYTSSSTFILFAVSFVVLLAANQLYFFAYKNWKEIIVYFREHEAPGRVKFAAIIYIVICASIWTLLFLLF